MKNSVLMRLWVMALAAVLLCLSACTASKEEPDTAKPVQAVVVDVEKYGHVVLDMTVADLAAQGYAPGDVVRVRFESFESDIPYYDGYYCNPGEIMLRGRSPQEQIAVCINYGDFSAEKGITVGDTAVITMTEKAGMLAIQDLCSLKYTYDRADYADDATFANFRPITLGAIGQNKLYRSASPVNNAYGRAPYADHFLAEVGIASALNLADSREDVEAFFEAEGFSSAYYRDLYTAGKVAALDLGNNFYTEAFAAGMAEGLTFLARNDPPYCIHCTEGKDRAGFAAMLLEALMGAELDEIIRDYMLSFSNYYGITEETNPERYQTVLDINLMPLLCHMAGVDDDSALAQIDLKAAATQYLVNAGMQESDIAALQEKLSQ